MGAVRFGITICKCYNWRLRSAARFVTVEDSSIAEARALATEPAGKGECPCLADVIRRNRHEPESRIC